MSFFDSIRGRKESVLSLNLEQQKLPSTADLPSRSATNFEIDPALIHGAIPDLTERVKIKQEAGIRPSMLYLAIDGASRSPVALRLKDLGPSLVMMVFTSGYQAMDYLRASGLPGGVHEFPATTLTSYIQAWKTAGAGAFALDRCPRCATCLSIPIKEHLSEEQLNLLWIAHRETRFFQAQRLLRLYLDPQTSTDGLTNAAAQRHKRDLLAIIRDHLDCSVPYLHWMIALEARSGGNETDRLAALKRLREFGPQFEERAGLNLTDEAYIREVIACQLGLLGFYELLTPDLQRAVAAGRDA